MKKIIALLTLIAVMVGMFAIPTSAAEPENIMLKAVDVTCYNISNDPAGNILNMYDGYKYYNTSDKLSYCLFNFTPDKNAVLKTASHKAPGEDQTLEYRVNMNGEQGKDDSKYLAVIIFELDKVYTVDKAIVYQQAAGTRAHDGKFVAARANLDGYDLLVSTDKTNWTTVFSDTEMLCGEKYEVADIADGYGTTYKTSTFNAVEAKYFAFAITQPRCQDEASGWKWKEGAYSTAPSEFRISEVELYTADPNAAPVETTAAPVETTAAPTTTAPTEAPATADASMIVIAAAALALATVVAIRRRVRG